MKRKKKYQNVTIVLSEYTRPLSKMCAKTGFEILQNAKGNIGLEGPHPANLE